MSKRLSDAALAFALDWVDTYGGDEDLEDGNGSHKGASRQSHVCSSSDELHPQGPPVV